MYLFSTIGGILMFFSFFFFDHLDQTATIKMYETAGEKAQKIVVMAGGEGA